MEPLWDEMQASGDRDPPPATANGTKNCLIRMKNLVSDSFSLIFFLETEYSVTNVLSRLPCIAAKA